MEKVNLSLDLQGSWARIGVSGYLSPQASGNLAALLSDLARMEFEEICLDLGECSPVSVAALEVLLERKFRLAELGVVVRFTSPPRTVSKVFQIMGLHPDGELPDMSLSKGPSN